MNGEKISNSDVIDEKTLFFSRRLHQPNANIFITNSQHQQHQEGISKKHVPVMVSVEWQDVSYTVAIGWRKEKKTIIKDHWGKANPGQMTALIGSSGSGKTTLLKILAGTIYRDRSGTITLNGKLQSKETRRMYTRYIMQRPEEHTYLTVREVIEMAAKLKFPGGHGTAKSAAVSEIIEILGLNGCQNTRTANISGGERKRLALAQELVDNPPVLFLDEPTSGLDSTACFHLVQLLKDLSNKGHTIVCSIHQPSARILNFFDKMYVLSKGECVFQDNVSALLPFLESQGLHCPPYHNPASYMLEVIAGLYGDYIDKFKLAVKSNRLREMSPSKAVKTAGNSTSLELSTHKLWNFPSNPWTQFNVILFRTYKSMLRNPILTHLRFVAHIVVSIVYGLLMWKIGNDASELTYNATFLFMSLSFLLFTSLMMTVLTFPLEMSILLKEHNNNWYSLLIYYLAKTIADLPVQAIFSVLYIAIAYWMTDQPNDSYRFGMVTLIFILSSIAAQSEGLLLGAALNFEAALFLGPTLLMLTLTFTNFFIRVESLPSYLKWIPYINYYRYSVEGTLLTIYGYNRSDLYCPQGELCLITNPKQYLETIGVENDAVWKDFVPLVCFIIILRALGYIVMKIRMRYQK